MPQNAGLQGEAQPRKRALVAEDHTACGVESTGNRRSDHHPLLSGNLDSVIADLDFHPQMSADRFGVATQRIDGRAFDVTTFDG